ncbi:uncharacterized protein LOC108116482 [Drosophila eugracilis]|uniref:uncharacterized protein LOC108116482 n=1 Tax=Drosophila eugracilis TaxID=29029 RepID=UPI001BDACD19|nr:uncharacterized protein LOC108116482 [Drosophila eugracilis]
MNLHLNTLLLLFMAFLGQTWGYSYLMVSHTASKSHHAVGLALAKGLAAAGHEVTLISPFPQKQPIKNIIDVETPNIITVMGVHKARILENAKKNVVQRYPRLSLMGLDLTEALFKAPAVQELLTQKRTFDGVIVETFMNDAHYGFAEHFGAPLISLSSLGATGWTSDLVGTPSPPSYVPHALLQFSDYMNFWQRAQNLGFQTYEFIYQNLINLPRHEALYKKYFPNNKQDFYEMRKSTSLVLLNNHVSLSNPRPYSPNMIEVGGMHVNRKAPKPLPKDIRKFIEGAEHGVIYFSLGSNLNSKDLPKKKRKAIVETLRGLKYRVLWKYEEENFVDKPDNVLVSKWFPQDDILAHDKVIAFITHGGLLSTMESIYHGKPVVGIPFFGDQFMNMARAEQSGYGITVKYAELSAPLFRSAIDRITTDPSYLERVKIISNQFRDQKETPLERAVYWVEHVTRQKGAKYLRSACQDLTVIEYHNLDVLAAFFTALGLVFIFVFLTIRFLVSKVKGSSLKSKSSKKKFGKLQIKTKMKPTSGQTSFLALLLVCLLSCVSAYNYLMVLHTAARSHYHVGSALAKGLANAGHQVTIISPFELKKPIKNIKDVQVKSILAVMQERMANLLESSKEPIIKQIIEFHEMGLSLTERLLSEPIVTELMKSNQTFDAVISEVFLNEAHFGFAEHFKAPLIGLGTFGAISWNTDLVGSPSPPSYVPSALLKFNDHMSLAERVGNLAFLTYEYLFLNYFYLPRQEVLYRKFFPNNKQDFYEMRKNTALVLLNQHVSLSFPRPYSPNMIEVGGMHINRKRQPLPKDIQEFIEGAEHGVIYFSMGSNLKSKTLPLDKRQALIDTFAQLKQRVLWKFEDTDLPGKPANVFISDWFPQDDILAHDNVIAFITHGGLLSTTESIYHRKPFVGIPIFGDQFLNMARAEQNGYGVTVHYEALTAPKLLEAIQRLIQDPEARQKVRDMSDRYRDQPETPLERAVFWVEHVSRHKGAKYLRSASQDLNFIQYHNLDAMFILYGGIIFVFYCIFLLVRWVWRLLQEFFLKKASTKSKQKVKKN